MKIGIVDNIESEWEKRAKWIMDQHWFQDEASFRLGIPEELDYEEWTNKVVQEIDSRLREYNQTAGAANGTLNEEDAPFGYVAKPSGSTCTGCAFDRSNSACYLKVYGGTSGQCSSRHRKDKQTVIFVRAKK